LNTDPTTGTVTGTVTTTSSRQFVLTGWVKTSHGRIRSEVAQKIDFSNVQQFVSPQSLPEIFVQNIRQSTAISSTTKVQGGRRSGETRVRMSWPLELDLTVNIDQSGGFVSQIGNVKQAYNRVESAGDFASLVSNSGEWADTYPTQQGQSGSQRFFFSDSEDHCFSVRRPSRLPSSACTGGASTGESKDQHHAGDSSHAGDLGMRPPIASSRGPRMCNLRLL